MPEPYSAAVSMGGPALSGGTRPVQLGLPLLVFAVLLDPVTDALAQTAHPPILVAVARAWRAVAAPALVNFAVTGSVACFCCYLVAGALLRLPAVARVA